jgi:hypothetical protein
MIENILPEDTLETGFRTKANNAFDEIINDDPFIEAGVVKFPKHGGSEWTMDLSSLYYTKDQVLDQIAPYDQYATESLAGRVLRATFDMLAIGTDTTRYVSTAGAKWMIENTATLVDDYTIGIHNFEFGNVYLKADGNTNVGVNVYDGTDAIIASINSEDTGWKLLSEQNEYTANLDFSNLVADINIDLNNLATTSLSGSWNLDGNALTESKGLGTTTAQDWTLIHSGNTVATIADGKIGIGTSSPSYKLQVKAGNANQLMIDNAGEQYTEIDYANNGTVKAVSYYDNTSSLFIQRTLGAASIGFDTNLTRRLTIGGTGNVGINTTTLSDVLTISTSGSGSGVKIIGYESTNFINLNNLLSTDNRTFRLIAGVTSVGYNGFSIFDTQANDTRFVIDNSGNVVIGATSTSEKFEVVGTSKTTNLKITSGASLGYVALSDANGQVVWTNPSSLNPWAGNWNANTNTPTLADGTGTYGVWYHVETAGTVNLGSGSVTYAVGDRVIYNGTIWVKQTQNYSLNVATTSVLGGIKQGTGLSIDGSGVASVVSLTTTRTIAASGDATWSVSFDGSANVTSALTLATVATAGTYRSVTVNAKGLVTAGTNPTTLAGYGITDVYTKTEVYTQTESDGLFVHLIGDEEIDGIKEFYDEIKVKSNQVHLTSDFLNRGGSVASYGVLSNKLGAGGLILDVKSTGGLYFRADTTRKGLFDTNGLILSSSLGNSDVPTERLDVRGNIRYNTLLKPNNVAGTNGQFLGTSGTQDVWTTLTTSHISNLSSYTGFDGRYVDLTTTQSSIGGAKTFTALFTVNNRVYQTGLGGSTYFGHLAGQSDDLSSRNNVGVGYMALGNITSGSNNVAIGYEAGAYRNPTPSAGTLTTNTNSIFIGSGSKASGNNQANQIVIGYGAIGAGANTVTLGYTSTTANYFFGTVKYGTLLKPNNVAGTNGQVLGTNGTQDSWVTLTASYISDLSSYTGFDSRYFTETESDARFVALGGSYANPTWITELAWSKLSGVPSAFTPSAHTLDSHSNVTITSNSSGEILKWNGSSWINNTLVEAGIQPTLPSGTAGQFLIRNASSELEFFNLELEPTRLTSNKIAVGDSANYLSSYDNFEFNDSRFISILKVGDSTKAFYAGMYGASNNSFITASGGSLTINGNNGLIFSNFTGGGTLALTVDNDGKVGVTPLGSGGSSPSTLASTYIGYGSSGNVLTGTSKFTYDALKTGIYFNDSANYLYVGKSADLSDMYEVTAVGTRGIQLNTDMDIVIKNNNHLYLGAGAGNKRVHIGRGASYNDANHYLVINGETFSFSMDNISGWGDTNSESTPQVGDKVLFNVVDVGGNKRFVPQKINKKLFSSLTSGDTVLIL